MGKAMGTMSEEAKTTVVPFDVTSLDTKKASEAGARLFLIHPATKRRLIGGDGKEIFWTIIGKHAEGYQKASLRLQNKKLKELQGSGPRSTAEELEENTTELLAACVVGWSDNFVFDGEVPAFSQAKARAILSDPRVKWIREQVEGFAGDIANFLTE